MPPFCQVTLCKWRQRSQRQRERNISTHTHCNLFDVKKIPFLKLPHEPERLRTCFCFILQVDSHCNPHQENGWKEETATVETVCRDVLQSYWKEDFGFHTMGRWKDVLGFFPLFLRFHFCLPGNTSILFVWWRNSDFKPTIPKSDQMCCSQSFGDVWVSSYDFPAIKS